MGIPKVFAVLSSVLWLLLPTVAVAVELPTQVSLLPQCALQCWAQALPPSCGGSLDNSTCICGSPSFSHRQIECVDKNCTLLETYSSLRLLGEMCELPRRDRSTEIWAILPLHVFAMICVITRLYAKAFILRRFGTDDWIILVTTFLYFGWFCVGHHLFQMAFGTDIWFVDPDDLTTAMMLFYFDAPIYMWLLGGTKASLLCFYLRLFPYERFRKLCYVVLTLVISLTLLWTAISIFQCTPIQYSWVGWTGEATGTCLDRKLMTLVISWVNITLDAVIIAMPIPLVLKMRSTPRRKFAVIIMFSMGVFVLGASVTRVYYVVVNGRSKNFTYDFVDMIIWTGIEIAASIIIASLPVIRLMLHRLFPGAVGRIFSFGGHGSADHEYLKTSPMSAKVMPVSVSRSRRFLHLHRRQPSLPATIGGGEQVEGSPKRQLEARKARHMAALRRGAGDASRALASILGTATDTFHRTATRSPLASADWDRQRDSQMGMGMAPGAFARALSDRLNNIRSSEEREKAPGRP